MITRRRFVLTLGSLFAGAAMGPTAFGRWRMPRQFAGVPLRSQVLRENIWAVLEGGGNSLLMATGEGTLLIDTKTAEVADELKAKVLEIAKQGPRTVINTHHHFDHTGSNYVFSSDPQAKVVAHRNLSPRMQACLDERVRPAIARRAGALRTEGKTDEAAKVAALMDILTVDDFKPDQEYADISVIEQGKAKATLRHFGNGHTDNDTVVHFADHNVVVTGDLVFHGLHAFMDRPAGANTVGWRKSLAETAKLCDDKTIVVPGHGEIGDRSIITKQIEYFNTLEKVVADAIKNGHSKASIGTLKPEAFNGLGFEPLLKQALEGMYDELSAGTN